MRAVALELVLEQLLRETVESLGVSGGRVIQTSCGRLLLSIESQLVRVIIDPHLVVGGNLHIVPQSLSTTPAPARGVSVVHG